MIPPIQTTEELLAHVCTGDGKTGEPALGQYLDWEGILARSEKEGIQSLVYSRLRASGLRELCPPAVYRQLENYYYSVSVRNVRLCDETKKILTAFREQAIRAIVLKGVFLAQTIYGNLASRSMSDIDLLVYPHDIPLVDAILVALGYQRPRYYRDFSDKKGISPLCSLMYQNADEGLCVDLHWHIINSTWPVYTLAASVNMEEIWSGARDIEIDGIPAYSLAPHHQLIFLASHAQQHCFDTLLLSADIFQTMRYFGDSLDWGLVRRTALRWRLGPTVRAALAIACLRLSIPVERFRDADLLPSAGTQRLIALLLKSHAGRYLLAYTLCLVSEKNFSGTIRFLRETAFPSQYTIAHNRDIPLGEVSLLHYLSRFVDALCALLPVRSSARA